MPNSTAKKLQPASGKINQLSAMPTGEAKTINPSSSTSLALESPFYCYEFPDSKEVYSTPPTPNASRVNEFKNDEEVTDFQIEMLVDQLRQKRLKLWTEAAPVNALQEKLLKEIKDLETSIKVNSVFPINKTPEMRKFYSDVLRGVINNISHEPTKENSLEIKKLANLRPEFHPHNNWQHVKSVVGMVLGIAALCSTIVCFMMGISLPVNEGARAGLLFGAIGSYVGSWGLFALEAKNSKKPLSPVKELNDIADDLDNLHTQVSKSIITVV